MVIQRPIRSLRSTSIRNGTQTSSPGTKSHLSNGRSRNSSCRLRVPSSHLTPAISPVRRNTFHLCTPAILDLVFCSETLLSLHDFDALVNGHTTSTNEYTRKFYGHIKTIIEMTRESCGKKLHVILKCLEEDTLML